MNDRGWRGVDLDGTLVEYGVWQGVSHVGKPVPLMLKRVREWLADGLEVRIFTARVAPSSLALSGVTRADVVAPIEAWCKKHLGTVLAVTCEKDMRMIELWDDRAVQVVPNTGRRADGLP